MSDDIKKLAELAGGQYPRGVHPNAIMFYPKELDRFVELIEKAQAARIAELEAALNDAKQHFVADEPLKAFVEICAALAGGKDE